MSNLRHDLPVQVSFVNPFEHIKVLGWRHLLPARWWSPSRCHIRFGPFVLHIPRRWWPARKDGVRRCANCNRLVWMEGPPTHWCAQCAYVAKQLRGLLWVSSLRSEARRANWIQA